MKVDSYNLTAGTNHPFYVPGRFFMLVRTSAPVTVRFIKNKTRSLEVGTDVETGYISEPGDWRDPSDYFEGFELFSATNQTVRVGVSDRKGDYRSFVQSVEVETASEGVTVDDQAVGVAADEIAAANADRVRAIVQNTGANAIRVGDADVSSTRGILLNAGGSATFNHAGTIWAVRVAADSTVAVLEENR